MLAPRIVNDVSYVRRINHEVHFAWQAQYLVKVEGFEYEQNAYGRTAATRQSVANDSSATCARWNHQAMAGNCLDGFC